MNDSETPDGEPLQETPDTCLKQGPATIHDEKRILKALKKILDQRSIRLIDASHHGLEKSSKSLRLRIKNLLPLSIYKMFSHFRPWQQQKQLGRMIAVVQQKNQVAWQRLGEAKAAGLKEKALQKCLLACEQSQLWLDLLEGRSESNVTIERARVVNCLRNCIAARAPAELQKADDAYTQAVHTLKLSIIHEDELRVEHLAPATPLTEELKQFEKMQIDEAAAREAYHRYGKQLEL